MDKQKRSSYPVTQNCEIITKYESGEVSAYGRIQNCKEFRNAESQIHCCKNVETQKQGRNVLVARVSV